MYNSSDYISVSSNTLSSALSSQYYTQSDTEAEDEIRCRKRGGVQRPGTRLTLTPRETTLRKKRSLSSTHFPVCQQTPKFLVQQATSRKVHCLNQTLLPASSIDSFEAPLHASIPRQPLPAQPVTQRRCSNTLRKNHQNTNPRPPQTKLNDYYRPTRRNPNASNPTKIHPKNHLNPAKKKTPSKRRHSNPFALLTDNNSDVEICSAPILLDYQPTPKPFKKISDGQKRPSPPREQPPPVPRHQLNQPDYWRSSMDKENYVNTAFPSSSCHDSGCDDERLEQAHRSYEETNFMNMSDKTYENLRMEHRVPVAGSCEATTSCSASASSSSGACSRGTASDSAMSCSLATSAIDDEPQLYGRLVGVVFTEARRLNPHNSNWRRIADAQHQLEAVFGLSRDTDLAQPFQQDVIFCKNCAIFCNRIAQRLRQTQAHSLKDYNYLIKKLQKVLSQLKMASEQHPPISTPFNSAHGTFPKFLERIKSYFK